MATPTLTRSQTAPGLQQLRWLLFGRAVPTALFALLGWRQFQAFQSQAGKAASTPDLVAVCAALSAGLYLLFCSIPVVIYLTRRPPHARDGSLPARVAAFTGTLMLLVLNAVWGGPALIAPTGVATSASALVSVLAFALAVWGILCLRRNLSIIPEARGVVTSGPYRHIRHPLYAAEILAFVAQVLGSTLLFWVIALPVFVVVQMTRAGFEERLLSSALPGYAAYAARTRRLIPGVW